MLYFDKESYVRGGEKGREIFKMGEKKKYSAEELLQYAYKYNKIPVILFAKDTECRYVYTSEIEDLIDGGEEHSILGKTDREIQYDQELGQMYYEQDKEIMRAGESWMYERTAKEECLQLRMAMESTNWRTTMSTAAISAIIKCLMAIPGRNWPACQCR